MNNVAVIRAARGLSQVQLAELAGVRQPHISRIERGDEGPPVRTYRKIAEALDVPLWQLFGDQTTVAEQMLLDVFRSLSEERQQGWIDMARSVLDHRSQVPRTAGADPDS